MSYSPQHYVTLTRSQSVFPILAFLFEFNEVLAVHRNVQFQVVIGQERFGELSYGKFCILGGKSVWL